MGRKPPSHLYRHNITLRVCTDVDTFQNPVWREYDVKHVNFQASIGTAVTALNVDAISRSLMFVDSLYTSPQLDWMRLKRESEDAGKRMQVIFMGDTYTVEQVKRIEDEYCRLDHWEVEMV